jgi:DNA repair protein RadD
VRLVLFKIIMNENKFIELRHYLKNITEGILRELIGQGICDAIIQYNLYINNLQVDYIDILENKFGNNILFEKTVFNKLIIFLEDKKIKSIAEENKINYVNIDDAREKILSRTFGYRNIDFSLSVINILELDKDKYFPDPVEIEDDFESKIKPNYHLHEYQKNLKDEVIRYLLNPQFTNRMLVHMPTGAGKTKTAMEIASDYLRCKSVLGGHEKSVFVVWLAHSKELCEQALETFQNTWRLRGDYEINTFKLFGDSEYTDEILSSERAFIFAGFQKFNSMLKSSNELQVKIKNKIFQNIKLVIVDEAHKSMASTYEKAINLLSRNSAGVQLIGLTATPGRSSEQENGENSFLAEFFNSTKIGMIDNLGVPISNPISYLQELEVLAQIDRIELMTDVDVTLSELQIRNLKLFGDEKLTEILNNLAGNPGRNKIIIDKVKELYQLNESILIFACNVEHCIILQALLKASGIDAGTILSSTTKFDREASISKFKSGELSVLINYGVLTTGFDAPKLNSLIIARPTSSIVLYSQMVGRALRGPKNGGNKINKLIDLRDNFNLGNESQMFNFYDEIWNN